MKPYIITYEIKNMSSSNYKALFDEIKKSKKWWHYIANSWIIMTDESSDKIYKRLEKHLDDNINILIFELGTDRQGWLNKKAWPWIKTNIPKK